MNLEDFHLIDNEPIDKSIIRKDYTKVYHNQGAQLNDRDQNIEFIYGESIIYHQIGNSYLQFDITVKYPTAGFNANAETRINNIAFANCFEEAVLATTGGMELEIIKYVGQVSTITRVLTNKDGDSLFQFDRFDDGDTNASINETSLKQLLNDNHSIAVKRGKTKGHLLLEDIFRFCKTFKK